MIPTSLPLSSLPIFGSAWLLSYAIHSTILLGAVWIIARWVRPSPGLLDSLWKMALVGGIVTATWQVVGIGHEPLGGRFGLETPAVETVQEFVFLSGTPSSITSAEPSPPFWAAAIAAITMYWPGVLLTIWVLGALLGLARLMERRFRLSGALAERRFLEDGAARAILDRLCRKSGITHSVRLSTSSRLSGPVALDSREICLPERALRVLSPEQLENVLAHELAHVARRDPAWRWLSAVVERIFFFQPLNRNARKGLRDVAEFMCDDWAVRHTGQNVTLARCLVEVAGWMKTETRPVAAVGMAEHGSPLVRRVERLLSGKTRPELSRHWKMAAVSLLLLGVVTTAPSVTVNPTRPSPTAEGSESPRSANSWVSVASAAYTPFYRQGEFWPMTSGPSRGVESDRVPEPGSVMGPRRDRRTQRIRTIEPVTPAFFRVVLRPQPEPGPEPCPAPSLIVVPEPAERYAVVFSVETRVEPIRIRLDHLVGELERLNFEIERANLKSYAPVLKALARRQQEMWPRLLELREKLQESGTLRLEVLAPVDCEPARIHELIRLRTIERKLHIEERKKSRHHRKRIHPRNEAPVIRI